MYRTIHILLWACCLSFGAGAQSVKMLLTGTVYNPIDGQADYLVSFTVTSGNVTGFSVTDYKNNNPLRTPVKGWLDASGRLYIKELPVEENGLLSSSYCYFTAILKPSVTHGTRTWTGPYESRRINNAACNGGTMTLYETRPQKVIPAKPLAEKKPEPAAPKPVQVPPGRDPVKPLRPLPPSYGQLPAPSRRAEQLTPAALPEREMVTRIRPGMDTTVYQPLYLWNTDSLVLEVWDGYWQDGDAISISWNGKLVKEEYVMSAQKVRLVLPLQGAGINTLSIYLAEDGGEQNVTPDAAFYDGPLKHQLNISGNKGETARIYFRRKRPDETAPDPVK